MIVCPGNMTWSAVYRSVRHGPWQMAPQYCLWLTAETGRIYETAVGHESNVCSITSPFSSKKKTAHYGGHRVVLLLQNICNTIFEFVYKISYVEMSASISDFGPRRFSLTLCCRQHSRHLVLFVGRTELEVTTPRRQLHGHLRPRAEKKGLANPL